MELSGNGGASWSTLVSVGDQATNAVWTKVTANVTGGSSVKLRMSASDGSSAGDLVEAGLDDFKICLETH